MSNVDENSWNESSPASTSPRRLGAQEILSLRRGVRLRLSREHETLSASGVGGEHRPGSAKIYTGTSAPIYRPDGSTLLTGADAGRLWVHADDGAIKYYDGAAWKVHAPTLDYFSRDFSTYTIPTQNKTYSTGELRIVDAIKKGVWLAFVHGVLWNSTSISTFLVRIGNSTVDASGTGSYPPGGTIMARSTFTLPILITHEGPDSYLDVKETQSIRRIEGVVLIRLAPPSAHP